MNTTVTRAESRTSSARAETAAPTTPAYSAPSNPFANPFILWFDGLTRGDTARVGGKGANLGEMTHAGLPVPAGYAITVDGYRRFYEASGLAGAIADRVRSLDVDDPDRLRAAAEAIQTLIRRAPMPDDVRSAILAAYGELLRREPGANGFVSVRSSATVEDSAEHSFAGMFESFLNVRGPDELIRRVKDCWASSFGARVLYYRLKQGLPIELLLGVVVQRMIDSEKSGVMFTVNPATKDPTRLVIEAAFGLGEAVVGGQVTPDHYEVNKASLDIADRRIARKEFLLARDAQSGETIRVPLDDAHGNAPVLTDAEIRAVADLGRGDERHYGSPQDIEFAIQGGHVYIVQTRPVTTLVAAATPTGTAEGAVAAPRVLLHGLGAGPGVASGVVRVLASPADEGRLKDGEILVTQMTSPDWVPIMRRAAAIVTDAGGMTSHAAIVSRELGIPCIVGTREGTRLLRDGMVVTVDARDGTVVEGARSDSTTSTAPAARRATDASVLAGEIERAPAPATPITATKLYVNLGEPDLAAAVAAQPVDGVGLLRAEFLMLEALERTHPKLFLEQGRGDEFVRRMAEKLTVVARAFHPRPVVYRAMDFRTNEFRGLTGGERFEAKEENPMIGYRGCFRYTRDPALFALELRAIATVREHFPNLHLMIPFVRTGSEFRECKRLIDASSLGGARDFELWVMAEVPSVVSWLEEYVRLGVTGVSIGSNDLTQLTLGVDRDSDVLAPLFDERDRAVLDAIRAIIVECKRLGITSSICGQAPSVHPDYVGQLVRWGIDSVSVNADVIDVTRHNLAVAERRVLLDDARARLDGDGPQSAG